MKTRLIMLFLQRSLGNVSSFSELDTVEFLMPFLDVIRNGDTVLELTLTVTAVQCTVLGFWH